MERRDRIRTGADQGVEGRVFNFGVEEKVATFPKGVLEMAKHPAWARAKTSIARQFTAKRFIETMAVLRQEIDKARSATG